MLNRHATIHLRASLHLEAQQAMRKKAFEAARELLEYGFKSYGPHLSLLSDLALCHYQLKDFKQFEEVTYRLAKEYKSVKSSVNRDLAFSTLLSLTTLFEKLGCANHAISLLTDFLKDKKQLTTVRNIQISARLLRLYATHERDSDVSVAYMKCTSFKNNEIDLSFEVDLDLQSALLHAEYYLFGYEMAEMRVFNLLSRSSQYKPLIFELLFESLRRKEERKLSKLLLEKVSYIHASFFEKVLWDLYNQRRSGWCTKDLSIERCEGQSPYMQLRYFYLLQQNQNPRSVAEKAKVKFLFLLKNFDLTSRSGLERVFKDCEIQNHKNSLAVFGSTLMVGKETINLKRSPALLKLVHLFSEKRTWHTDELIQRLFLDQCKKTGLRKLKAVVYRTNKRFMKNYRLARAWKFNKSSLDLNNAFDILNMTNSTSDQR